MKISENVWGTVGLITVLLIGLGLAAMFFASAYRMLACG